MKRTCNFFMLIVMVTIVVLCAGCATRESSVPSPTLATTTSDETPANPNGMKTISETAEADSRFTTLVAVIKATEMDTVFNDPDSTFTVFAPTDDAFRNLPEGTMDTLLKDPQGDLSQILLYHVVSEKLMTSDLEKRTSAETLQGGFLPISISNGTVTVDGARIIITDIECSNGVIHGVDTVMLPPA